MQAGLIDIIPQLHREGITSIKDIGRQAEWDAFESLAREDRLKVRVCMLWRAGTTLNTAATLAQIVSHPRPPESLGDGKLLSCGAKLFMDGSAAARTAWSYRPWYKDQRDVDEGNQGFPRTDPDVYRQQVRLFHEAGVMVGTHAVGERAIDYVVDTYAQVLQEKATRGLRHTIIHVYLPTAHAVSVMASLEKEYDAGYPEVQPAFMWWLGETYLRSFGLERLGNTMP